MSQDLMTKLISLCKRRGFVFQSSEIYGGLKSCYDYGHLGVELKRNIANHWWKKMVYEHENVVGFDSSIIMHPKVWETSGHLANFSDPLVDCQNCKSRFRGDKAPKAKAGELVSYKDQKSGKTVEAAVDNRGYICPECSCPILSDERFFQGMFKTTLGPVDPVSDFLSQIENQALSKKELLEKWQETTTPSAVYLRPETAQGMFVQYLNVQQTSGMKVPFGIAQIGKSFRNEIVTEHFIFRSCEFEQMEMEFFCEPGTQGEWLDYWKEKRLQWYQDLANDKDKFRLRRHEGDELAHYSDDCYDIEYQYPWGWDELEGIASRTDYDLNKHAGATRTKISYFDQNKVDPNTQKNGYRYVPYVIEPAAGLQRTFLCLLADAYTEEELTDPSGGKRMRTYLKLDQRLCPYKAAILPLVKKDGQPEMAEKIAATLRKNGIPVILDANQSIGKRYAKHDEIGTPLAITIDNESLIDQSVTVRSRDTAEQIRMSVDEAVEQVSQLIN